jgi:NitT/TauT family transport system permease protein
MLTFISKNKAIVLISTAGLLLLWELLANMINQEILIPHISLILGELYTIVTHSESLVIIGTTLGRVLFTFVFSLALTLILGIPAGLWKPLEMALKPLETAARSVPTMGIILLSIIWLGSEGTPLFVTSLIIFPVLYRGLIDGIHNIDNSLIIFHQVHRVPFFKCLFHFYIPAILPSLKTGCVSGLGLGFKVMIAAEVLSQPKFAIGTTFQIERSQLNTAGVMAWCIVIIVIAAVFETLLQRIGTREKRIL